MENVKDWFFARSRTGAYVHVALMFVAAIAKVSLDAGYTAAGVEGFFWRLFWVVVATGWALRMLYLADKEPEDSRQMHLARRGGVLIATLMIVGVAIT